jgi:small subunit ribosomal protein S16
MAVAIRLARQGSLKHPFYRVVASDSRSPRDGRFIEQIGTWDPRKEAFVLKQERYAHWVSHGARPSTLVKQLVHRAARAAAAAAK